MAKAVDYQKIESDLKKLTSGIVVKSDFLFDLLKIYNFPASTIKTLRTGKGISSKEEQHIVRGKFVFESVTQNVEEVFDALREDSIIEKHKLRFAIATDYKRFMAYDTKTQDTLDVPLSELSQNWDFFLPWLGREKYIAQEENPADVAAAEKMGKIYDEIVKTNPDFLTAEYQRALNLFLTRLLFCFYAEDSNIFEGENAFTKLIDEQTNEQGEGMNEFLADFFASLDVEDKEKKAALFQKFPYVNGSLFSEKTPVPIISGKARKLIIECGRQDWQKINPDIFGSMFQAVSENGSRATLGQHYTSVPNIMKVLKPLFLDSLYEAFEKVKDDPKKLRLFWQRLTKIKFFDPACGSGNFLIIAYKQIRLLEIEVVKRLDVLEEKTNLQLKGSNILLKNFYGIEIDDFAKDVAVLALWLADHQMNCRLQEELGVVPATLPLQKGGNIVCANALRIDWNDVCPIDENDEVYVFGNPPYLGGQDQNEKQKADLEYVFKRSSNELEQSLTKFRFLDYVSGWFVLSAKYIQDKTKASVAFVSTNSICQGKQVATLWPHVTIPGIEISFAYKSFKWCNNAKNNAGVTCVIIGLRNVAKKAKFLFINGVQTSAKNINPYLEDRVNVVVSQTKTPISNFPHMSFGNMPNDGGCLILSDEEKKKLINDCPQSEKYIKKLWGSQEFIKGKIRWCLWIKQDDLIEAEKISFIKDRIEQCKKKRLASKDKGARKLAERPWSFRDTNEIETNAIIIPRVSSETREYIPMGFLDSSNIILDSAEAVYNAPLWLLGVLTSRMHMVWVRAVGGRLKTDYRYSAELCYNTFPFPELARMQIRELEDLVRQLLQQRERNPEKTMAELYDKNKMPLGLKTVHTRIDNFIDGCYRSKPFASDEERLETLLELYQEATSK